MSKEMIYRDDAIDAIKTSRFLVDAMEKVIKLPSAQPEVRTQMSVADTISRQAAIDALCLACGHDCDKSKFVYNAPQDEQVIMCPEHYALSTLPSAQPKKTVDNYIESLPTSPLLVGKMPSAQPETNCSEIPNNWIPCSKKLPEEPFGCLVTVWDTNPITMDEFENILPYFVGWDGEQWNDADGEQCPFEVIAWMPLPEPHRGEEK